MVMTNNITKIKMVMIRVTKMITMMAMLITLSLQYLAR